MQCLQILLIKFCNKLVRQGTFFFTVHFSDREPKRVIICRYITSNDTVNAHVIAKHEGNSPVIVNGLTSPITFFDTTNTATRSTCVCRTVIYE